MRGKEIGANGRGGGLRVSVIDLEAGVEGGRRRKEQLDRSEVGWEDDLGGEQESCWSVEDGDAVGGDGRWNEFKFIGAGGNRQRCIQNFLGESREGARDLQA